MHAPVRLPPDGHQTFAHMRSPSSQHQTTELLGECRQVWPGSQRVAAAGHQPPVGGRLLGGPHRLHERPCGHVRLPGSVRGAQRRAGRLRPAGLACTGAPAPGAQHGGRDDGPMRCLRRGRGTGTWCTMHDMVALTMAPRAACPVDVRPETARKANRLLLTVCRHHSWQRAGCARCLCPAGLACTGEPALRANASWPCAGCMLLASPASLPCHCQLFKQIALRCILSCEPFSKQQGPVRAD